VLNEFTSDAVIEQGLKSAGMDADMKMIKLWTRLKVGALETAGKEAADQTGDEKVLANARMRVRSIQPYLDAAQGDIITAKWTFVQGYLGVIFSQKDAFQTVVAETYPGSDPVSLASKDALVTEGNNIIADAEILATAAQAKSEPRALAAYAKLSLSYDRFLKAGDLYGNALLLPSRQQPKAKATGAAKGATKKEAPAPLVAEKAKREAAEVAADQAEIDLQKEAARAKKAEAEAKAAVARADRAEAESEKADRAAEKAAAEKQAAGEKKAEAKAKVEVAAKAKAEDKDAAKAKAAAEAAAKAEAEADAKEKAANAAAEAKEAAEQAAEKEEAEKLAAVSSAEERLKAAEAAVQQLKDKETKASVTVKLYEKALAFEAKQEKAARKLATQTDATSSLVPQYDPLTSTESLYRGIDLSQLKYSAVPPKVKDAVVVIAGPDKGRVGTLLGVEKGSCIVKLSTRELKVIDISKIAKQQ